MQMDVCIGVKQEQSGNLYDAFSKALHQLSPMYLLPAENYTFNCSEGLI